LFQNVPLSFIENTKKNAPKAGAFFDNSYPVPNMRFAYAFF